MEEYYKSIQKIPNSINTILALVILSNMWCFYILSKNYEANMAKIMEKTTIIEKELEVNINKSISPAAINTEDLQDYITSQFPKVLEKDAEIIASEISKQCLKHGVSFPLVAGLIDVESSYDKLAKSGKDSYGLMQIRYKVWGPKLGVKPKDLHRIKVNINFGIGILKYYIDQNGGNITKALQDYNGACGEEFPNKVYRAIRKFVAFRSAYENGVVKESVCVATAIKHDTAKVKINGSSKNRKQPSSNLRKRKRVPPSPIIQRKHKAVHV